MEGLSRLRRMYGRLWLNQRESTCATQRRVGWWSYVLYEEVAHFLRSDPNTPPPPRLDPTGTPPHCMGGG